jgi:polyferredoxin
MVKVGKPKGLIRYASYNSIKEGIQKLIRPRVLGYIVVLLALVTFLSFMIATRSDIETTILKVPGTLFQRGEDGTISNLYNVEFVNKTFEDITLEVKVDSPPEAILSKVGEQSIVVPAGEMLKSVYFIKIPADKIDEARQVIMIGVYKDGKRIEKVKVKFIGPVKSINP